MKTFKIILISILFISFPIFLNWVIQIKALFPIVGDEETWLSFWATYSGVILTALMVYMSYATIKQSTEYTKASLKSSWLKDFRNVVADIKNETDSLIISQVLSDIYFGNYDGALQQASTFYSSLKKNSNLISSFLIEAEDLFDRFKQHGYIKKLSQQLQPYVNLIEEIIQFAIICNYLKSNQNTNNLIDRIAAVKKMREDMDQCGYSEIVKAIDGFTIPSIDSIIQNTTIALQKKLSNLSMTEFESLLNGIISNTSNETYTILTFHKSRYF